MITKHQAIQELNKYTGIIREHLKNWKMEPEHVNFLWDYLNKFAQIANDSQKVDIDNKIWGNQKDFMISFTIPKIVTAYFDISFNDYEEGDEDNGKDICWSIHDWQQSPVLELQYCETDGGNKTILYFTRRSNRDRTSLDVFYYRNGKPGWIEEWKNSHRFY